MGEVGCEPRELQGELLYRSQRGLSWKGPGMITKSDTFREQSVEQLKLQGSKGPWLSKGVGLGTAGQAGRAGVAMQAQSQGQPAAAGGAKSGQRHPQQLLNLPVSKRFWKVHSFGNCHSSCCWPSKAVLAAWYLCTGS